ncbi:MAG: RNA methyltransferase [Thermonemataceae bacterium]|nr:RNA methyltransferase [Thermonemataceae bacterium]
MQYKKYRKEENLFLVEGVKSVLELIKSDFTIKKIFYTEIFEKKYTIPTSISSEMVSIEDLKGISFLENNQEVLAVVEQKSNKELVDYSNELLIALDNLQDPGNLGTIIRVADWYGIKKVICSRETVDFYNPKVIAASMGSFMRVEVFYADLNFFLKNAFEKGEDIYGTLLNGDNIYKTPLRKKGIVVMGNEAKGISEELLPYITQKITIPRVGGAESLNVGIATAVVIDNFFRN